MIGGALGVSPLHDGQLLDLLADQRRDVGDGAPSMGLGGGREVRPTSTRPGIWFCHLRGIRGIGGCRRPLRA